MITSKYLIKVDSENNHNKFYRMTPYVPDYNHFCVEYGRVSATALKRHYPISSFNTILEKKLNDGYVDQSENHQMNYETKSEYKPISNPAISDLVSTMLHYADIAIQTNYTIKWHEVTENMLNQAQKLMNTLSIQSCIEEFNKTLLELFSVIPRKMFNVNEFLATTDKDFGDILLREYDLFNVMKQKIVSSDNTDEKNTILQANGIEIRECTIEETEKIKHFLDEGSNCSHLLKKAYYVKNAKTERAFEQYCKNHHIKRNGKNIHFYYHGSRNMNWWNIVSQGLTLNPGKNVIRTGAMFGNGLYFAPSARKSLRYTSLRQTGTTYTNGDEKTALMAVYKVAYKNPYIVYTHSPEMNFLNCEKIHNMGYDSTFASKELGMLYNDEVIIYKNEQATIRYLLELEI